MKFVVAYCNTNGNYIISNINIHLPKDLDFSKSENKLDTRNQLGEIYLTPVTFNSSEFEFPLETSVFESQNIFVVHVDNDESAKDISTRCSKLLFEPSLLLQNQNVYYFIFEFNISITDFSTRNTICKLLYDMFRLNNTAEAKDNDFIRYNSNLSMITSSDTTHTYPDLIAAHALSYIDSGRRCWKKLQAYYKSISLEYDETDYPLVPDLPNVCKNHGSYNSISNNGNRTNDSQHSNNQALDKVSDNLYYNNRLFTDLPSSGYRQSYNINGTDITYNNIATNCNLPQLYKSCNLLNNFINDPSATLFNLEVKGIITNLNYIEGGMKKCKEVLDIRSNSQSWFNYIYYNRHVKSQPMNCSDFCPYASECIHHCNIVQLAKPTKYITHTNPVSAIPMNEAFNDLTNLLSSIVTSEDGLIHVVKALTGLGKTIATMNFKNVHIAFPRHNLKEEYYNDLMSKNGTHDILCSKQLDEETRLLIKPYYNSGNYIGASKKLRELASKSDRKDIDDYLAFKDKAADYSGLLLTTHESAIRLQSNKKILIFDEDPLNSLCPIKTASKTALASLNKLIGGKLKQLVDEIEQNSDGFTHQLISKFTGQVLKEASCDIFYKNFISNIYDLLTAKAYFVKQDTIIYMCKRELPINKTIIIMSATVDEELYKKLYGDRVVFHDIGYVLPKGNIIQDCSKSNSRFSISDGTSNIELVKKFVKDGNLITYMSHEEEFTESTTAHYGDIEGTNKMSGCDLGIFGTDHKNTTPYFLLSTLISNKSYDTRTEPNYQLIEYNNMIFYFNAFDDDDLRKTQLSLINSSQVQSIGRARILRNDCTVYVFTNLPIRTAIYDDIFNGAYTFNPHNKPESINIFMKLLNSILTRFKKTA